MNDLDDYTWNGDTWWCVEMDCPWCGDDMGSNGTVRVCFSDDEHWELIE